MYSPDDRYCPVAEKEIDCETCYEMVMCIDGCFKASSVPEIGDYEIKSVNSDLL